MKFSFVSLFPNIIQGYFGESILKKASDENLVEFDYFNPRDFTQNKHKKVDDSVYGGGAGQLISPEPMCNTLDCILKDNPDAYIIFPLAAAKPFNQNDAKRLADKKHIVFVCGRYEGIDERVIETYANEVFSIGDYILTGGELASMVMSDSIARNIDGVLGNSLSLKDESYNNQNELQNEFLEAPAFTKPEKFRNMCVPSEFLKGNHSRIQSLKSNLSNCKTKYFRP